MCSGTMSHCTTGPHDPLVACGNRGVTSIGEDLTDAVPAVNSSTCDPVPRIPRSANAAFPAASVMAVVEPSRVPPPEAVDTVTVTPGAGLPSSFLT
jgi:hypothetical protein